MSWKAIWGTEAFMPKARVRVMARGQLALSPSFTQAKRAVAAMGATLFEQLYAVNEWRTRYKLAGFGVKTA